MRSPVTIYVRLLDEAVDVWRPVKATHLDADRYEISQQEYDRSDELWQFEPGEIVVCHVIAVQDGDILAAVRSAN